MEKITRTRTKCSPRRERKPAGRDQPQQARISRSEKRLKERTDEHLAKNLLRMTREAEQIELRLRDDMEKLIIQQEQTLGTLDTKIDGEANSGYHGQVGWATRKKEWIEEWGNKLRRAQQGAESELQ